MFKRIALFVATNLAVIFVLSIVLRLLGVDRILDEHLSPLYVSVHTADEDLRDEMMRLDGRRFDAAGEER